MPTSLNSPPPFFTTLGTSADEAIDLTFSDSENEEPPADARKRKGEDQATQGRNNRPRRRRPSTPISPTPSPSRSPTLSLSSPPSLSSTPSSPPESSSASDPFLTDVTPPPGWESVFDSPPPSSSSLLSTGAGEPSSSSSSSSSSAMAPVSSLKLYPSEKEIITWLEAYTYTASDGHIQVRHSGVNERRARSCNILDTKAMCHQVFLFEVRKFLRLTRIAPRISWPYPKVKLPMSQSQASAVRAIVESGERLTEYKGRNACGRCRMREARGALGENLDNCHLEARCLADPEGDTTACFCCIAEDRICDGGWRKVVD